MTATAAQLPLAESVAVVRQLGRGGRLLMLEFVLNRGRVTARDFFAEWPAVDPTRVQKLLDSMVATGWLLVWSPSLASPYGDISLNQVGIDRLERALREHWDWQVPAPVWDVDLAMWEAGCIKYTQPRESQLRLLLERLRAAQEES